MSEIGQKTHWKHIHDIAVGGNSEALAEYLDTLSPSEVARAISRLDDDSRTMVITLLEPEEAADLLEELDDVQGADILEDLPTSSAAAIVEAMESDERADVLSELDIEDAEAILAKMDPEEAADARHLLTYPSDTAGGVMVTEFLAYAMELRVADVLKDLRVNAERYSDLGIQYLYVVNDVKSLVGVVRLRDLVLSRNDAPLTTVMIPNPVYALVNTPLEEIEDTFERYTFVALPVTDETGRLVGMVRRGDAEHAAGERADKALMRFSGIIGGDELRTMPLLSRVFPRMSWLTLNLLLSLLGAAVISHFQSTIGKITALAVLIPMIGNLSGCSGNQAVGVSIRELALGITKPEDALLVLVKEAQVGVLNGILLGVLLTGVAVMMNTNAYIGLIAGGALAMNTVFAICLGGLMPLLLRRLNIDPALSAPPIVTSLSDMCGFFIFLSLATWLLV